MKFRMRLRIAMSSESSAPSMATRRKSLRPTSLIRDEIACVPQVPARRGVGPGHRLERRPPGEGGGGDQEAREVNRRNGDGRCATARARSLAIE